MYAALLDAAPGRPSLADDALHLENLLALCRLVAVRPVAVRLIAARHVLARRQAPRAPAPRFAGGGSRGGAAGGESGWTANSARDSGCCFEPASDRADH